MLIFTTFRENLSVRYSVVKKSATGYVISQKSEYISRTSRRKREIRQSCCYSRPRFFYPWVAGFCLVACTTLLYLLSCMRISIPRFDTKLIVCQILNGCSDSMNKPTRCTFCMYLFYSFCTTLHVSIDHFIILIEDIPLCLLQN